MAESHHHERGSFVVHRDENRLRQLPAQFSVGLRGERRRVGDEQDDRLDQSLPGFVFEADLRHHFEELIEQTPPRSMTAVRQWSARMRSNSAI